MSATLKKGLRVAALVLLLAVPLAVLFSRALGGFVRDVVAVPLLYLAWISRLYLRTIPQALFWGALVVFGLALAVTNLVIALGSGEDAADGQEEVELEQTYAGSVRRLVSQIRYAERSAYFRRRLSQRLARLILSALDYEEPYGRAKVDRGLDAIDAPPEVRDFLHEGDDLLSPTRRPGLIAWLRRRLRGRNKTAVPSPELERVVRFLEDRLEVL